MKNMDIESLDGATKENVLKLKEFQEIHANIEKEQEREIRIIEKSYFKQFKNNWQEMRPHIESIKNFQLTALLNSQLKTVIKEHDKPILEHLKQVELDKSFPDEIESEEFELTFHFSENEWFSNTTLKKKYFLKMNEEDEEYDLQRSEATTVDWKTGKRVTHEVTKKKQKHKKTKEVRWVEHEVERESFFNIFKSYEAPEEEDENADEEFLDFISTDLMIGQTLSEDILNDPTAYFLGEVDDIEDEEFEDEEYEDEEQHPKGKGKKALPQAKGKKGAENDKEECKNN